ncbi:MAG: SulP family inorganic anion transporter [Flavobacteriales bacterium]|nr:SulP family inorganic anion transporter [Flavobacteriales bacterium]
MRSTSGPPDLSAGFSAFTLPDFSMILNWKVWLTAGTMALVASLETLLSVEATDKLDPEKRITPTDKELRAQGIGNIASGLIGGLPITGDGAELGQPTKRCEDQVERDPAWPVIFFACLIPSIMEMIPLASLAAILFTVGFKLAKPALFANMWKKGWVQFVPFLVTVLGVVFMDLLKGVSLGMVVGIFIVLRNSYLTPFHFDGDVTDPAKPLRIELSEEVTFFNKASIQRTLANLPDGARVVIDAGRTVNLDADVMEIIEEEMVRSKDRGVNIELICATDRPQKGTKVLTAGVIRAARRIVRGN